MNRIVYIQYTNPAAYPPLEHSSRILAMAGWKVLFLGTGAHGADRLTFPPHANVTVKRLSFCPAGIRQKLHYLIYCLWAIGWILGWRPGVVYASDLLSCPAALALSLVPGLRILYHEHDSPTETVANGWTRVALWCRRLLVKRAACSILPNQVRVDRFQTEVGNVASPVLCVWNCPRREEISARRSYRDEHDVWIHYHGSIGPACLPVSVLPALARLPDRVKLRVIGYETVGNKGYVAALLDRARELGLLQRIEFLGPMPRFELLRLCQRGDIGLALMPSHARDINMAAMAGASNKAFDYLACGLTLVVSDLPDWRTAFVEPGYAVACDPDDPRSIERALGWLVEHPAEMRAMGEGGRQRIEREWNYETQFSSVYEVMR